MKDERQRVAEAISKYLGVAEMAKRKAETETPGVGAEFGGSVRRTDTDEERRGRPAGAKSVTRDVVHVALPTCKKCGSTERDAYRLVVERAAPGVTREGLEYTHVCHRRTRCQACGQHRVEIHYERRVA